MLQRWLLATAFSVTAALATAQVPAGAEFRVNTYTTGAQVSPHADAAPNGDFVVVWSGPGATPGQDDVFAQRYSHVYGSALGAEFRVNTYTTGTQQAPRVAVNPDGSFVVLWDTAGTPSQDGFWVQRFNRSGVPVGAELRVDSGGATGALVRGLAADARGNFVVTWSGSGPADPSSGIFARRVSAQGVFLGDEFLVNTYTSFAQGTPEVAMGPAGDFVIVWTSIGQDGGGFGVFGQKFDAAGARVGGEFRVNTTTASDQTFGRVALHAEGDFVVAWCSYPQDGSHMGVYAQRFDSSGARLGGEFRVNTYTPGFQFVTNVAADDAGAFVVTWQSEFQDGSGVGVFGQRFSRDGVRRGAEFRVNTFTAGDQLSGGLAHDAVGNFVVAWKSAFQDGSGDGIYAQRFGGLVPFHLHVDRTGNRVLEPGENVALEPMWRNLTLQSQGWSGTLGGLAGPAGLTYTVTDGSAVYVPAAPGVTTSCSDCYAVSIGLPGARPQAHVDATALETLAPDLQGQHKRWTLHVGESFADIPTSNGFYLFIEVLLHQGVTAGCTSTTYCPAASTSREQMAVFVLVAKEGTGYVPPACTTPVFADVPASSPFCAWVEELARRGVVSGCGGANYCPAASVTREQMAVFVLRTMYPALNPPACGTPMFADVPASSPFCRWIEELARLQVVAGCGGGNYCPADAVTREQMAVFVTMTFNLLLYGM